MRVHVVGDHCGVDADMSQDSNETRSTCGFNDIRFLKIAFLQYEIRDRIGVMYLSAALKLRGHITEAFTLSDVSLFDDIEKFSPDVLAISASTSEHPVLYVAARKIKQMLPGIIVVLGGPHGTFFPEELERVDILDIVCIGEGDRSIPELADRIAYKNGYNNIRGLWVKTEGKIYKNPPDDLIENLDMLPFPDREIYYTKYPQLRDNPTKTFILGRGCPFDCTYCFNHQMRKIYPKGYVRRHSADYAILMIKDVQSRYGFKWVQFIDSTLNANKPWLIDFMKRYKTEIGVPFLCGLRFDLMDVEITQSLLDAGVNRVNFGVESGNEEIRKRILNRSMGNKDIVLISDMFNKAGVRIITSNMIGLPGETIEMALETIRLNQKIRPESAVCYVLVPYPGTDIHQYCVNHNLLKEPIDIDNLPSPLVLNWVAGKHIGSVIKLNDERELINLHNFFDILVHHPKLEPVVKVLIRLPPNRIFDFVGQYPIISKKVRYSNNNREKIGYVCGLIHGTIFKIG